MSINLVSKLENFFVSTFPTGMPKCSQICLARPGLEAPEKTLMPVIFPEIFLLLIET